MSDLLTNSPSGTQTSSQTDSLSSSVEAHLKVYFAALGEDQPAGNLYNQILQQIEKPLFELTLDQCRGNQLRAADMLGLNRNTLRKKIQELGICSGRKRRIMMKERQS